MKKKIRIIGLSICLLAFYLLCSIPFMENHTGMQVSFFEKMVEPNPYYKFNPIYALAFLVPAIVFACSFFWKIPFKWWQYVFFGVLTLGVAYSFIFIIFAVGLNSGNKPLAYHPISVLLGLLFLCWSLVLAIPFPSKWHFMKWPFDSKNDKIN